MAALPARTGSAEARPASARKHEGPAPCGAGPVSVDPGG